MVAMAAWIKDHPDTYPGTDSAAVALADELRRLSDNSLEIRIVDTQGGAHVIPSPDEKPVASLADRDHFKVQQDPKTRGLFVSDAVSSHINGKWVIPVSYPVLKPGGAVTTVVASVQIDRIAPAFELQRYQPSGSITLIKTNGATLFRAPAVAGAIGKMIGDTPDFVNHLNAVDRGQYRTQGVYDKSVRLVSHSRLTAYPVIVAVTLSLDDALIPWREEVYRLFGGLLVVTVATLLFASRFRRAEQLAQRRLAKSEKRFRSMIEHAPEAIIVYDPENKRIIDANPRAEKIFECSRNELLGGGIERFYATVQPDGLPAEKSVKQAIDRVLAGESVLLERLVRTASGREAIFEVRVDDMSEDGRPLVRGSFYDITERKEADRVLRESEQRFRTLVETSPLPMLICGLPPESKVLLMNQRFTEVLGYTRDDIRDIEDWWPLAYPDEDCRRDVQGRWTQAIAEMLAAGEKSVRPVTAEVSCKNGSQRYLEIHMTVAGDRSLVVFNDLTDRRANELELDRIAHYDTLTGVANRILLGDRLHQSIVQAERKGDLLAVCYLDLDGFKPINDTYGHDAGDRLLVEIAERLRLCLRGADTVGRLGGDEFVILLLGLERVEECEAALKRILDAIKQPVVIQGHPITVSASIGVSVYPHDDADPDTLLRHADQAMYQAKHAGKNQYRLFDAESDRRTRQHREMIERLQIALKQGELVLHFQPKVDMRQGLLLGVEALIRWQHPERGLLPPGEFLPQLEDSEMIVTLGDWVIGEALRQAAIWQDEGLSISVSVNIAARHLQQQGFVARLREHLAAYPQRVAAGHLELEVLETAALEDMAHISKVILECREQGVAFALDDFGTGYSSLAYLRRLPAETLKIDQTFVRDMLTDPEDRAIVAGIIRLAETFGRKVIAEGVETVEIGQALLELGCSQAQGYGIARPMPGHQIPVWAGQWPNAAWQNLNLKNLFDI